MIDRLKDEFYFLQRNFLILGEIGKHLKMFFGLFRSGINIVTGRVAPLPIGVNSFNARVSGTGVREYAGDSVFPCEGSKP